MKNGGATALCESLKANKTLTTLNLGCIDERIKLHKKTYSGLNLSTGNNIEGEGGIALSHGLEVNNTLTALDLSGICFFFSTIQLV